MVIVACEQLIQLVKDGMQQLTRCRVPMLKSTVGIDRQNDVFSDGFALLRSPPNHHSRHGLLHVLIQAERLVAREDIPDTNFTIVAALGDVFVVRIETDAHGLRVDIAERESVRHFDLGTLDLLQVVRWRERQQVFFVFLAAFSGNVHHL